MRRLLLAFVLLTPAVALTPEQWREDLAYLARELPSRHINAFAQISRADFAAEVKDLHSRIPNLPEPAIRAAILKVVASIGDGHTNAGIWGRGGAFPLSLEETCRKLADYVAHENEAQLKAQVPNMLLYPELLQEIGAAEGGGSIRLEVVPKSGGRVEVDIEPVLLRDRPRLIMAYTGEPPLYQMDGNVPYSAMVIRGGNMIYFRYNQCVNDPNKPFSAFAGELEAMLSPPGVRRLIIDLRNNGGGNSAILDPFIGWVKKSRFNRKGRLVVLIGRRTFSSAILNAVKLRNETAAVLVGEPTGGKPNHFGEVRSFELPNSKIGVSYSTKYFHQFKEDTPSLMPDLLVELSSRDYLSGADPVLASIWDQPVE